MASTAGPKPIPDTYRRVTPALVVEGGMKALSFYAEVFGATDIARIRPPDAARFAMSHRDLCGDPAGTWTRRPRESDDLDREPDES